jgi:hypothetical protein
VLSAGEIPNEFPETALAGNPSVSLSVRGNMKRLVACLVVTMVVPVVSVAVEAAPAQACSCVGLSDAEAFASADAVFVGRLIGYEAPRAPTTSSLDPAVWTFKVREVYKGKVSRKQEVVSAVSGASCGLEIPKHGKFLVFGKATSSNRFEPRPADGQLQASLCGGTRALGDGALDPGLGKPYPPGRTPSKHR